MTLSRGAGVECGKQPNELCSMWGSIEAECSSQRMNAEVAVRPPIELGAVPDFGRSEPAISSPSKKLEHFLQNPVRMPRWASKD